MLLVARESEEGQAYSTVMQASIGVKTMRTAEVKVLSQRTGHAQAELRWYKLFRGESEVVSDVKYSDAIGERCTLLDRVSAVAKGCVRGGCGGKDGKDGLWLY